MHADDIYVDRENYRALHFTAAGSDDSKAFGVMQLLLDASKIVDIDAETQGFNTACEVAWMNGNHGSSGGTAYT